MRSSHYEMISREQGPADRPPGFWSRKATEHFLPTVSPASLWLPRPCFLLFRVPWLPPHSGCPSRPHAAEEMAALPRYTTGVARDHFSPGTCRFLHVLPNQCLPVLQSRWVATGFNVWLQVYLADVNTTDSRRDSQNLCYYLSVPQET